jgi:adenine-specific DNA-methyltransferase
LIIVAVIFDFIVFKKVKNNWKVYIKQYQFVDNENKLRERTLPYRALIQFLNSEGSQELNNIVQQNIFKFPKSSSLIEFCINLFSNKNITVLDFFAGSGTTGHAVLKTNEKDKGNRNFILCTNNENNICEEVTYERLKKVINGFTDLKGNKIDGIKGNLKYLKTSYVSNNRNKDQLKIDITKRCTEMICMKEGIFTLYKEENDYKIFYNGNRYLAVYYDFANISLEELKEEMNLLKGEKILIHQEDSIIFKNNIMDFINFDYIGAPWPKNQDDNFNNVGNGVF